MFTPCGNPGRSLFRAATLAIGAFLGAAHLQEIHAMTTTNSASAEPTSAAIVELRQYTLHPFKRDVLIDLFEHEFVESQEALGIRVIGTFRDLDDAGRFVWLRGFTDMPARAEALQAFYSGPVWKAHREVANATMVDSDNVLLLRPALADSGFESNARALVPRDATGIPQGLIEVRIYYFDSQPGPIDIQRLDLMRIALDSVGATRLAVLCTEPSANNFPRLPVREDEPAIVVISEFRNAEAYAGYIDTLAGSPQWRRAEGALLRAAPRAPDILRLVPTARSRLPR
jgi:hypothetical protein